MSESVNTSNTQDERVPLVPGYVERRENCPRYVFSGGIWIVLADKDQTSGHIANLESVYGKCGGLPRHVHQREVELAYVISGRLRVRIGDEAETTANPGAMVFIPRGIARSFVADVDETRVYHGFIPAGFEVLITENGQKTERFIATLDAVPFDAATAKRFGVDVVND